MTHFIDISLPPLHSIKPGKNLRTGYTTDTVLGFLQEISRWGISKHSVVEDPPMV